MDWWPRMRDELLGRRLSLALLDEDGMPAHVYGGTVVERDGQPHLQHPLGEVALDTQMLFKTGSLAGESRPSFQNAEYLLPLAPHDLEPAQRAALKAGRVELPPQPFGSAS